MQLSYLATQLGAKLTGDDAEFFSVSTDSRALQPGDLFVALKGERFDAHDYLQQVFDAGAIGAVVEENYQPLADLQTKAFLHVTDTMTALGQIGKIWLAQFDLLKVAITGSCGKTSVKEMLAAIFSQVGETLATQGNLNNNIGVPLTLCRVQAEHRFAVIEMGANHRGEIAYTSGLTRPDIALVNNVAAAHLEGFGSLNNVAEAKAEIYAGLANDGTAVINLDDDFAPYFKEQTGHLKQACYSLGDRNADVFLADSSPSMGGSQNFEVSAFGECFAVQLSLLGLHNVANALAAITIAKVAGVNSKAIAEGLRVVKPYPGRLYPVSDISTHFVIDDSYNANPRSVRAAIDLLSEMDNATCLVVGGMGELGDAAAQLHFDIGAYAAGKGIQTVYAMGAGAEDYQRGYNSVKPSNGRFVVADSHQDIAQRIARDELGKTILVKGSRSAAMENVIRCLRTNQDFNEETL